MQSVRTNWAHVCSMPHWHGFYLVLLAHWGAENYAASLSQFYIGCLLLEFSVNLFLLDIYMNVAMLPLANLRQGVDLMKDEALHNLMLPMGLMCAFKQSLRCVKRGIGMLGIPCNSFTFMSSSQHERTVWQPWGHMVHPWVIEGNCLAARSCLIIMLLIARSVWWLTENPGQSALQFFPVLQHLMAIPEVLAMRIYW